MPKWYSFYSEFHGEYEFGLKFMAYYRGSAALWGLIYVVANRDCSICALLSGCRIIRGRIIGSLL